MVRFMNAAAIAAVTMGSCQLRSGRADEINSTTGGPNRMTSHGPVMSSEEKNRLKTSPQQIPPANPNQSRTENGFAGDTKLDCTGMCCSLS